MQSLKNILTKFNPTEDKYISREFQKYGYDLSEELGDYKHTALYIKLAKTVPRPILEKARNFVKDSGKVQSKPRLFMWKMAQLRKEWKERQVKQEAQNNELKHRSSTLKRVHILISGDVIGVGFRHWVYSLVKQYSVFGWVRNTSDQKVEILIEGENEVLYTIIEACKKGPTTSSVSDVFVEESPFNGEFKTFEIIKQ
jgi:acylphosphatase